MNVVDGDTLNDAFRAVASDRLSRNPNMIQYELVTAKEVAGMTSKEITELKDRLPNFFYQRDLGFIRFFQIAVHEHAATALLAYHYNISYNQALLFVETQEDKYQSQLTYMYNSVDLWLRLGNRAFFSGAAMGTVYAKEGTLNSDERDMFEHDFGYKLSWIE